MNNKERTALLLLSDLTNIDGMEQVITDLDCGLGITTPKFTRWMKRGKGHGCSYIMLERGKTPEEILLLGIDPEIEIRIENFSQEDLISKHFEVYGEDAPLVLAAGGDPDIY